MILSGKKKEEYRDGSRYWIARLTCNLEYIDNIESFNYIPPVFKEFDKIIFKNGYSKDAPSFEIECKGIEIGFGKKEWGAEQNKKYFILKLGNIIS